MPTLFLSLWFYYAFLNFVLKNCKFVHCQAQVYCYSRGDWERCKKWSETDIKLALTLRTISRKAYRWLRNKKILPLPGESTLRQYMSDFQVPPGTVKHFLDFYKDSMINCTVNIYRYKAIGANATSSVISTTWKCNSPCLEILQLLQVILQGLKDYLQELKDFQTGAIAFPGS